MTGETLGRSNLSHFGNISSGNISALGISVVNSTRFMVIVIGVQYWFWKLKGEGEGQLKYELIRGHIIMFKRKSVSCFLQTSIER